MRVDSSSLPRAISSTATDSELTLWLTSRAMLVTLLRTAVWKRISSAISVIRQSVCRASRLPAASCAI
ncbi:hypothetical protein D3C78_1894330 [compost metagenome]